MTNEHSLEKNDTANRKHFIVFLHYQVANFNTLLADAYKGKHKIREARSTILVGGKAYIWKISQTWVVIF